MASSGILWIDTIFDVCVIWLFKVAYILGITYEEINVYLFCIAWPLLTIIQTIMIIWLLKKPKVQYN